MKRFDSIEQYGERTAIYADRAYSYAEMMEAADSIADEVGDRTLVFCLCANNKESIFGYVGFLRGRIVPLLLDAAIHPDQLQKLIDRYQPTYIWADRDHDLLAQEMDYAYAYGDYALFVCPHAIEHELHAELALLLTTSGSTGSPKLVRLSYANLFNNAESIVSYLDIGENDRPITTLPMNYSYGLSIINSHLVSGATIIVTDASIMQKEFWQLCRDQNVTTFGGVPFLYEMLDRLKFETMELPSLTKLTQAGGKLKPALATKFAEVCERKGIQFFMMYGQTEATARMSYLPPDRNREKAGSIGIAIPGGELTLRNETGETITSPHVVGELIYRGANVSFGYANALSDLTSGDENEGVLHTGDLAYVDEDGYFFIVGRIKRMIKMHGNRISLDEVEDLLQANGHECICTGADDELYVYTLRDDALGVKQVIKDTMHTRGVTILRIDSIPRNESGKILYSALPKRELITT
ncbi:AMP-dependent synthetase [Exiguobacterium sp. SH5S13]|uniref:AMP-binding protein n=1 Tax=unclassified Exiguobacterium TaxID=2644629 RepID=UPI00103D6D4B|nr:MULTISPECIES: AMP-binding protein [unclassified Exiguobacterium]TCI25969.1 AMP-dependent synthetase [Exiguobacterium sp. SH5S4]TCI53881.1 AMP-dependent synthetase [Exiguobacterium sp. SH5S13]